MTLQVRNVSFYRLPMRTRFPFRYGIAALTELPHLFVRAEVEFDSTIGFGMSADGLPPKWFTKNPETTFENDDLPNMRRVIRNAADLSVAVGPCGSYFDWWKQVYDGQRTWAKNHTIAPLLSNFGFSLLERAVLDAFCRTQTTTLHQVLRMNLLNIDLQSLRALPAGIQPHDFLPTAPRHSLKLRHTVGLGDPLTQADVGQHDVPSDGLPFTLEENIARHGLTHFKIKLSGNFDVDHERLNAIASIVTSAIGGAGRFTLDGNENYPGIVDFRDHWERHRPSETIRRFMDHSLMLVEQPIHRDLAFDASVRTELDRWPDAPAMIIDESDADFESLPTAIELGYAGTSHKNCKGIIKGLTNAATVAVSKAAGRDLILSAEDLANVGPVALLQDLAMVATLGIDHVERNGHHYFAGLSQLPASEQQRTLRHHSDLYVLHDETFPTLRVQNGTINTSSVVAAPFGVHEHPDTEVLEHWEV